MSRPKCYHTMDAFVKLVVVLVRYSGEPTNTLAKVNLLNKVCIIISNPGSRKYAKTESVCGNIMFNILC